MNLLVEKIDFITKYIIILILLTSGISKIFNPYPVIELIQVFDIPDLIIVIIISFLSITEIGIAFVLLFNLKSNLQKYLLIILFSFFLVISVIGSVMEVNQDCGCFGSLIESKFGIGMIIRNTLFLLIVIFGFKSKMKNNYE